MTAPAAASVTACKRVAAISSVLVSYSRSGTSTPGTTTAGSLANWSAQGVVTVTAMTAAPIALGAWFHAEIDRALQQLGGMGARAVALVLVALALYLGVKLAQRYLLIRFLRSVRVTVGELKEMLQREARPVILDARSAFARKLDPRAIPGAIAVDIDDPGSALPALPGDREIVVYCS